MSFEKTLRWFGPNDPVSLKEIKQAGATGIVTALHQIPIGSVWPKGEIIRRKKIIEAEDFRWSVVESIPVHEDIKRRSGNHNKYIDAFKQTIRNLAECGINTVCYNFMPVLDWSRTNLEVTFRDESITSRFDYIVFAAFDLFIFKRKQAELDYDIGTVQAAEKYYKSLKKDQVNKLTDTILLGFPGSLKAYSQEALAGMIESYKDIDADTLSQNLIHFIKEIIPVAEESNVLMAIHPDDPPWPLFGLPRIVSTCNDLENICGAYDSVCNGITFCSGSFGAGYENDLPKMAKDFASRIHFLHLRNVSRTPEKNFIEENHLEGDIDIYSIMRTMLLEQKRRVNKSGKDARIPLRPDHGHLMIPDLDRKGVYPGYSLFGRMRGLSELAGVEHALKRELNI